MLLLNFGLRCEEVNFVDAFKKSSRVNGIEIIRSLSYTKLFKIESCWKVFNNRCTNRQTGIKDYNMYAMMFTHTMLLTHMLLFYHAALLTCPRYVFTRRNDALKNGTKMMNCIVQIYKR
jgi:hypothetical protein